MVISRRDAYFTATEPTPDSGEEIKAAEVCEVKVVVDEPRVVDGGAQVAQNGSNAPAKPMTKSEKFSKSKKKRKKTRTGVRDMSDYNMELPKKRRHLPGRKCFYTAQIRTKMVVWLPYRYRLEGIYTNWLTW
jgi:hypothetical protein